jgi:enoyl-CoA hydratase
MSLVRYESKSHVATVTMDRRSAHNALNNELCSELRAAWQRFRDSDDRVAVLASAEDDYYTVGADVNGLPDNMWHAVPGLGVALDKPVIAATSGWVVGGGFVLVQMADLCVASETTRFIYP